MKKLLLAFLICLIPCVGFSAQHDGDLDNQYWKPFRADLNRALSAVITQNSGATDPGTTQINSVVFTGTGLNDATSGGTYSGSDESNIEIIIDATGTPDTFKWRNNFNSPSETYTAGVAITGAAQTLVDGVTVTFAATTGHTLNDKWEIFSHVGATFPFMGWVDSGNDLFKQRNAADSAWINIWKLSDGKPSALDLVPNLKENLTATTDPGVNDDGTAGYSIGSRWVNVTLDKIFEAVDVSTGAAVWKETSAGAGGGAPDQDIWSTITPDSGTSPVPDTTTDALTITGGTGIATVGNSGTDTLTVALDDASDTPVAEECIKVPTTTTQVKYENCDIGHRRNWEVALVASGTDVATATTIGGDFRFPFSCTIADVWAYVDTAGTTGTMTVDIHKGGTTIMTTNKISIETTEKHSDDAATAPGITTTAYTANDILTIDVDVIQTTAAKGLKVGIGCDQT